MGNFMGQDAGQLVFIVHRSQQPAVNKNIAGRNGKSVILSDIDHLKFIVEQRVF